ncbi:MAG: hypothetical protein ACI4LY_02615 [Candidatus Fimisoma sp.]
MRLDLCVFWYIIAISFQLAGALLLIVRYWFKSVEDQLKYIEGKRTHTEGNTLMLGASQPNDSEMVEEIWLNRLAFAYIAVGYLLGIWGDPLSVNRWWITLAVVLLVCILVVIGKRHSEKEASKYAKAEKAHKADSSL